MKHSFSLTILEESSLRKHLQTMLEELPNNLPLYNEVQVLDDLSFLLRSPIFLYAISPRLRQAKRSPESLATGTMTPQSMDDEDYHRKGYTTDEEVDISKLNMRIKWDSDSWVTQLRYGESTLLEGRQYSSTPEPGFVQSFHWFCEEARFLWYEFRARETAAAARMGSAVESGAEDLGKQQVNGATRPRAGGEGKERRRTLKLKLRLRNTNCETMHSTQTK